MSDTLNEQLSAFIDGELPRAEADLFVRRLPRDPELRSAASRCYLIGQAIRVERSSITHGFGARVIAAIAREAPVSATASGDMAMARSGSRSRMVVWWKPAAGIAVAASVALVAILVVQNQQGGRDLPQVAAQITDTSQLAPAAVALPAPQASPAIQSAARTGTGEPASYTVPPNGNGTQAPFAALRLASYVLAHSEYSSLPGRRNVVSDAAVQENAEVSRPAEAPAP